MVGSTADSQSSRYCTASQNKPATTQCYRFQAEREKAIFVIERSKTNAQIVAESGKNKRKLTLLPMKKYILEFKE